MLILTVTNRDSEESGSALDPLSLRVSWVLTQKMNKWAKQVNAE